MLPKPLKQFLSRGAKNAVDLVDLVQLIRPWKQWEEANYFEEYAAQRPDILSLIILLLMKHDLWGSVIPSANMIRKTTLSSHYLIGNFLRNYINIF